MRLNASALSKGAMDNTLIIHTYGVGIGNRNWVGGGIILVIAFLLLSTMLYTKV